MKPMQHLNQTLSLRAPSVALSKERLCKSGASLVALLLLAVPACGGEPMPDSEGADLAGSGRHLFPAPEPVSPPEGAVLTGQPLFSWQIDKCQERVVIEICTDSACADVTQRLETDSCTGTRPASELAPGSYSWRAARLRGKQLASTWSPLRSFAIASPPPVVTADLFGVWSVGPSEVYAVGAGGTLLRYTGSWSAELSPTTRDLRAVWAPAPGQAFAVGAGGTLLRRTGNSWSASPSPTTEDLYGVWGSGPSDVWAAGNAGLILHFDGSTWTVSHNRMAGSFLGVWGSGARDVWVVGSGREPDNDYAALLLHWDGTSWTESYLCNPEGTRYASGGWIASLTDVWGGPGGTVWAAGRCQSGASFIPFGYVAQKDAGGAWADTPGFGFGKPLGEQRPLQTIWSSSGSDVWAASAGTATMLHFDGTSWTPSADSSTAGIYDLGGTAAGDVWAVGKAGKRLHFDGTTWSASE
jgi:hypothetical protein